jgi:glutathione peroxidase
MKTLLSISILIIMSINIHAQERKTFFDFSVTAIDGSEFPLSSLKGKKVLVVNTASKCGHTPQYAKLEELYQKYLERNFTVVGFPANNFMNQEPGSDEEILEFCQVNYGVSFPMMSKIPVKGDDIAPVYKWLTRKSENGVMDAPIKWNFQKFLINEDGTLAGMIPPGESPLSEKIINWIEGK